MKPPISSTSLPAAPEHPKWGAGSDGTIMRDWSANDTEMKTIHGWECGEIAVCFWLPASALHHHWRAQTLSGVHGEPLTWWWTARFFKLVSISYCWSFTYRRKKRVADAESRIRGEVLVGDEADPDLTAFGGLTGWYQLRPTPATQDALLSQVLHLHKVVPCRQKEIHVCYDRCTCYNRNSCIDL